VTSTYAGLSDADSLVRFADVRSYDTIPYIGDSTLSYKQVAISRAADKYDISVLNVYPNPVSTANSSLFVTQATPGGLLNHITIVNALGVVVEDIGEFRGDRWLTITIPVPRIPGTYYVRMLAGDLTKIIPFNVIR
jgi:hypothetical protein